MFLLITCKFNKVKFSGKYGQHNHDSPLWKAEWTDGFNGHWGHPLSTYAKFSEKLTFLTPWYAHVQVFRKILRTYWMDGPVFV